MYAQAGIRALIYQEYLEVAATSNFWIPACAGMTATAVSDDFYGLMIKFIRKYENRSSETPTPFSDDPDIYSAQSCVSSESL